MPRRAATLSPMSTALTAFTSSASFTPNGVAASMLGIADLARSYAPIKRFLQASTVVALLGVSGGAWAQTPVCFDSVGHALPPEQC